MTSTTQAPRISAIGSVTALARRLALPAVGAGLVGGLLMIAVMTVVMGAAGMGYASPLNLGMPAFVYTIAPPPAMLPTLMVAMGITLPATAMAQVGPTLQGGHYLTPAMAHQLAPMLTTMHVPATKVAMMGSLMTGHATNHTVATLMSQLSPTARDSVMRSMPVSASHVVVGSILHFAFAAFLGVAFFAIIMAAAWVGLPGLRTAAGVISAAVLGGAIVYVVNRWGLLPHSNPMMRLVPQTAFFLTHLLFGLTVGVALAMMLRRRDVRDLLPARR